MRVSVGNMQSLELSSAKSLLQKLPKGINRGSVYNEKVVTRDGHDLTTWESVFCLCVCRTLVNEGLQHFRTT